MIRRRIPAGKVFDAVAVANAISSVLGRVPVSISSNGLIEIDATPTGPQLAALRSAVLPLLEDVQDITTG